MGIGRTALELQGRTHNYMVELSLMIALVICKPPNHQHTLMFPQNQPKGL
jgi:hypothetical protein